MPSLPYVSGVKGYQIEPKIGNIPCIFPGYQGNFDGDGFAADCNHRQIAS